MLPGILMADLNIKHGGAGSLCTVIFGRLLKFPPVVLAWRIEWGFVLFVKEIFPRLQMGHDKKLARN